MRPETTIFGLSTRHYLRNHPAFKAESDLACRDFLAQKWKFASGPDLSRKITRKSNVSISGCLILRTMPNRLAIISVHSWVSKWVQTREKHFFREDYKSPEQASDGGAYTCFQALLRPETTIFRLSTRHYLRNHQAFTAEGDLARRDNLPSKRILLSGPTRPVAEKARKSTVSISGCFILRTMTNRMAIISVHSWVSKSVQTREKHFLRKAD